MKNFIKSIIIILLSVLLGWVIFTQTERGKIYTNKHLSKDADLIKSQILNVLNATGVVLTGTNTISGGEIQYSETGSIIIDQAILNQRLDYYRKEKEKIWKE